MKDWVKLFVRKKKLNEIIDKLEILNKDKKEMSLKDFIGEDNPDDLVSQTLTDCFNIDFPEEEPIPNFKSNMINAFGLALADLPQEVFNKLHETKNLVFTFSPKSGEIKQLFVGNDIIPDHKIQIVIFPYDCAYMLHDEKRGMIVRELAHIYLLSQRYYSTEQLKKEPDETAKKWGFEKEIKALSNYNKLPEEQVVQ
jgi:hypothetical protein